jgi:CBS domain-containing protein
MSRVCDVLRAKGDRVLMVAPDTPAVRVAQRMREEHVGAFVVSSDGRRVEGLITERDIVLGLARYGQGLFALRASELISQAVHTCRPDDSVRSAMATMTNSRVRHLPVVEHGELCGIISIGDVIKSYVDETDLEASVMRDAYLAQRSR